MSSPTRDDILSEFISTCPDLTSDLIDKKVQEIENHARYIKTTRSGKNKFVICRNDPCMCGSGKKYKKCHGGI
jgi:uncharacterized protein YecA (UPF0149 family)